MTDDDIEDPVSECCGAGMTGEMVDVGLCPACKEHCEVVEGAEEKPVCKINYNWSPSKPWESSELCLECGHIKGNHAGLI